MLRKIAVCAGILGISAHAMTVPAFDTFPTNDPAVSYRWTIDVGWRPVCQVRVTDAEPGRAKRVSIFYRNQSHSRIDITVRMNSGDPQERQISGCVGVEQVLVARN